MHDKLHLIIISLINTQGQIVQIHLIKICLTEMYHETMGWKFVATMRSAKQEPNVIPFVFDKSQIQSCFKKIGHND